MKSIKTFVAVAALSMISFGTFAQSISASASASTLDRAEAKIAAQAAEQGASYKITSAQFNNRVHMTAELTK
ncbi:TPA: YdgH/BhsA/McbA-like domain containing protein [Klebsiella oxytoca]